METIGRRIRIARQKANLKLEDIGRHLDVTPQAVQQWETGRNQVPSTAIVEIVQLTGVDLGWLMTGIGNPKLGIMSSAKLVPRLDLEKVDGTQVLAGIVEEDMQPTLIDCSGGSFWFEVADMRNAPEFLPGDRVILDPKAKPHPDDMVLARVNAGDQFVFAAYSVADFDGQKQKVCLTSLNPSWGRYVLDSADDLVILGTMVSVVKPGRSGRPPNKPTMNS